MTNEARILKIGTGMAMMHRGRLAMITAKDFLDMAAAYGMVAAGVDIISQAAGVQKTPGYAVGGVVREPLFVRPEQASEIEAPEGARP